MNEQLIEDEDLIMTKQGKLAFVHDREDTLLNDNPGANRSSYCVTATHDLNVKKQGKLSFVHNGEHTLQDDNPSTDHSSCCIGCYPFKKKNKIDYQCWTHERICHFCFVGFFFLCTGIDVWEAKDWKHCFPNIWRHIKLTTRIRLISAVNFFLFPKENPKVYCSVCYGKIYWLFCVVAWNIFIRKLFTFKHFQFIRVHPSSFIPVGQNI